MARPSAFFPFNFMRTKLQSYAPSRCKVPHTHTHTHRPTHYLVCVEFGEAVPFALAVFFDKRHLGNWGDALNDGANVVSTAKG